MDVVSPITWPPIQSWKSVSIVVERVMRSSLPAVSFTLIFASNTTFTRKFIKWISPTELFSMWVFSYSSHCISPAYQRFLRWVESEGGAHFRHKSGSKRRGRGKGIFMACNRSGFVSSEKTAPPPDRTGPFRLGFTCTAYIHATEHNDGWDFKPY